jgi:hypothetical protein
MVFWVFAKVHVMRERIVPPDPWFRSLMSVVALEAGLIAPRPGARLVKKQWFVMPVACWIRAPRPVLC